MEISVLMSTYNCSDYVKKALDSILKQKINVSYEIVICDDASEDGTQEILKSYKSKYPSVFRLYLREKNSGHPTMNAYLLSKRLNGKYVASLEGDDYWTDDYKLQKQYDFLEKHKEFSGCVSDVSVVNESGEEIDFPLHLLRKENQIYTINDFKRVIMPGMTCTFFRRNIYKGNDYKIIYKADKMMGDVTSYMLCLLRGDIYQFSETMAAYRYVCKEGETNFNSINKHNRFMLLRFIRFWISLENYMRKKYERTFELEPIFPRIRELVNTYSFSVWFPVLNAANNKKYIILAIEIYALNKLHDSFGVDRLFETERKVDPLHGWLNFMMDRRPIIIFGAGGIGEWFLDHYGWKQNIMFIVDNDSSKWGKSLKGYLIRKPEEIRKYPKNIVLICNEKYESDIQKQVRQLGSNKIYCLVSMRTVLIKNRLAKLLKEKTA